MSPVLVAQFFVSGAAATVQSVIIANSVVCLYLP